MCEQLRLAFSAITPGVSTIPAFISLFFLSAEVFQATHEFFIIASINFTPRASKHQPEELHKSTRKQATAISELNSGEKAN